MNASFLDEFDKFLAITDAVEEIWGSVLLRAAWFEAEGEPRPLIISLHLHPNPPESFPAPKHTPEVGAFKVGWQACPIRDWEKIRKQIREGFIQVGATKLKLEHRSGEKWTELSSGYANFERPGVYDWRQREFAEINLFKSESMGAPIYNGVRDRELEEKWRSLPIPYWDKNDILKDYFQIPEQSQQDNVIFRASAEIPIKISQETHFRDGHLDIGIELPANAKSSKVSLAVIATAADETTKRIKLKTNLGWRKRVGRLSLRQSFKIGPQYVRLSVLLRYGTLLVERRDLFPTGSPTANLVIAAHAPLDSENEFFIAALSGRGKDRGGDFERAMSWLMSFCGFSVLYYGKLNPFDKSAPDILAVSKRDEMILAIECTVSAPNTEGKLVKLREKCREIQVGVSRRVKVVPVLATAMETSSIPDSDRNLALQDKILLLGQDNLMQLHGMASAGQPLAKIIQYIRRLRGSDRGNLFGEPEEF